MRLTFDVASRLFAFLIFFGGAAANATTLKGDPGKVRFFFRQGTSFDYYIDNATAQQKQAMNLDFWQAEEFSPHFDPMTSWYPNALDYMDSIAIYTDQNPNMNWVIKDKNKQPLFINFDCNIAAGTCTQYAADITNTSSNGFRAAWINNAKTIPPLGYRGLWVDDVNLYNDTNGINLVHGDGTPGIPVDPNTGLEMTATQWNSYMAAWMTQIRTSLPTTSEILQNSLWYAGDGAPGTDPNVVKQISQADLINIEGGICDTGLVGGTSQFSLSNWFTYIDRVHNLGKGVVLDNNSVCTSSEEEYTLAGYYMISNGTDATSFPNVDPVTNWWNGFNTSLGAPLGARFHRNGSATVWERDYANGIVLLNEPGAPTVTVTLPTNYSRIDGSTVNHLQLPALTGAVLLNSASNVPPQGTNPPDPTVPGTNSSLPDPDLSLWPNDVGITQTLNPNYDTAAYPNVIFNFTFTPAGSAPSARAENKSLGALVTTATTAQVSGKSASLSALNLSLGTYVVSVQAVDTQTGQTSNTVSKTVTLVSGDSTSVVVYPNPWRKDKDAAVPITFSVLPQNSTVKIFTLSGHLIKTLNAAQSETSWDRTNKDGDIVASGIYLYLIASNDGSGQKSQGKIAIIQ